MKDSLTFEPFVYTSVASHYVNGYQCVVIGKELNKHSSTIEKLYELSQSLCQQGYRQTPARMGIVIKSHFFFIELSPLERDWMGRRGSYVTGLCCNLKDLYNTPTRSAYALPDGVLEPMTHEQVLAKIKEGRNKFEKTLFLPGKDIPADEISPADSDKGWLPKNIGPLSSALEGLAEKQSLLVSAEIGRDSLRFCRALSSLVPSGRRLLTYADNPTEADLKILGEFSVEPHILFRYEGSMPSDSFRKIERESKPESEKMQKIAAWFNDYIGEHSLDYCSELEIVSKTLQLDRKSIGDFWGSILDESRIRQVRFPDCAVKLDASECVRRWRALFEIYKDDSQHLFERETIYRLANDHSKWFSRVLEDLDDIIGDAFSKQIAACLREDYLAKWKDGDETVASMRSTFEQFGSGDTPHHIFWSVCDAIAKDHHVDISDQDLALICDGNADKAVWKTLLARAADSRGGGEDFARQLINLPQCRASVDSWVPLLDSNTRRIIINTALQSRNADVREWCYQSASLKKMITPELVDTEKIAVRGQETEDLISAIKPNAEECFGWWRRWPDEDSDGRAILTHIFCNSSDQFTEEQCFTVLLSSQIQNIEDYSKLLTSIYSKQSSFSYNSKRDEFLANRIDGFYRKTENPKRILESVLESLKTSPGLRNMFLRTCIRSDIKGVRVWSYDQEATKQAVVPMTFADIKARNEEFRLFAEKCLSPGKAFELWQKCPVNLSAEKKILWSRLPDAKAISRMNREQQKNIFQVAFDSWCDKDDSGLLISALQGMLLSKVPTVQDFKDMLAYFERVIFRSANSADIFKNLENRPNSDDYHSLLQIIAISCQHSEAASWGWKDLLMKPEQQIALWKKYPRNELSGPKKLWNEIVASFDGQFRQSSRLRDLLKYIADRKDVNLGPGHENDLLKLIGRLAGETRIGKRDSRRWNGVISLLHSLSLRSKIDIESVLLRFHSNLNFAYKPHFAIHCARCKNLVIRKWGKATKEYKDNRKRKLLTCLIIVLSTIAIALLVVLSYRYKWPAFIWGRDQDAPTETEEAENSSSKLQEYKEDAGEHNDRNRRPDKR